MAVFKCKMCGGTIEFEPGATVGVCDYCGTKQTLPRLDDDRKANFYMTEPITSAAITNMIKPQAYMSKY